VRQRIASMNINLFFDLIAWINLLIESSPFLGVALRPHLASRLLPICFLNKSRQKICARFTVGFVSNPTVALPPSTCEPALPNITLLRVGRARCHQPGSFLPYSSSLTLTGAGSIRRFTGTSLTAHLRWWWLVDLRIIAMQRN